MTMKYTTSQLHLRVIEENDLGLLKDYLLRNREFLKEWEPVRTDSFYQEDEILQRIKIEKKEYGEQRGISLYIFLKNENKIIGNVHIDNIVRGVFMSCYLGYKLDKEYINKGYMTQAVEKAIDIAFEEYKLHRIEANIMPRNIRSRKVVEKLGFENEGLSKKYLKINGVWEDHMHYVKLNHQVE
ncbi:MAG: GNAT family N-acetyltransferase [Candidatus Galacturonibacter soehngenii]|nr:GNAT family N-acetyltransferase [Candidatus Galacturonibacter soehngenii]